MPKEFDPSLIKESESDLENILKHFPEEHFAWKKIKMLLLLKSGSSVASASKEVNISKTTALYWRKKYNTKGLYFMLAENMKYWQCQNSIKESPVELFSLLKEEENPCIKKQIKVLYGIKNQELFLTNYEEVFAFAEISINGDSDYAKQIYALNEYKRKGIERYLSYWGKKVEEEKSLKLSDIAEIKTNFPTADFWITRRGSLKNVGKPTEEFNSENFGIRITSDKFIPKFIYYFMENSYNKGYWRAKANGTTNLQNIRMNDVKNFELSFHTKFFSG